MQEFSTNMVVQYLEKLRPGVKPIFSPDSVRHEFFAIAINDEIKRKNIKNTRSDVEFISINHKKINILLFYKNRHNILYHNQ